MKRIINALPLLLAACLTTDPPTMPLTSGAEIVEIRDADTIKSKPIDTKRCTALGQASIGPVEDNNFEIAIKNETFARGGNFFFGTAYGGNLAMKTVTGMVYKCPAPGQ